MTTQKIYNTSLELPVPPTPEISNREDLVSLVRYMANYRVTLLRQATGDMAIRLGEITPEGEPIRPPEAATEPALAPMTEAYNLLASTDRLGSEATRQLCDPSTGGWLTYMLEHIRLNNEGSPGADPDIDRHAGYIHSMASAAAIRSGMNFQFKVPVWGGRVMLPGLGQATLREDSGDQWGVASLQAQDDEILISSGDTTIRLSRSGINRDSTGWTSFKTVSVQLSDGSFMQATLDHLNPYRRQAQAIPPSNDRYRLSSYAEKMWLDHIRGGMELLAQDHPQLASMISIIMRTIVPIETKKPHIPTRPFSASAAGTVGGTEMNWPEGGPAVVASTLAHEIAGHNWLNLVMIQNKLVESATQYDEKLYAPWRDDVRHAFGLLHGIVSFAAVAKFWQDRIKVEVPGTPEARLANFEVAHWREQLLTAANQLLQQPELLTLRGNAFLQQAIMPNIELLWSEPLTQESLDQAAQTTAYNRARWTAHHLAPTQHITGSLADSWMNKRYESVLAENASVLQPDPDVRDIDTWGHMTRVAITKPINLTPGYIPGTTEADVAFIAGDTVRANHLFLDILRSPETYDDTAAIVGLGFTLTGGAGQLLRQQPYIFRAVQREIVGRTGQPAPAIELAEWIDASVHPIKAPGF